MSPKQMTNRQLEIIEAAGKILSLSGVSGLTIKNLAKEMKFSESAIYRHFSSKEDIVVALLEYLANNMEERYHQATSLDASPEEKFKALFMSQFVYLAKHPYFVTSIFSDGLMVEGGRVNEAILKIMTVKMKYLMPIIMSGQQKNVFTNALTAEEIIDVVMGTMRLQMFKWRVANYQFDIVRKGENTTLALLTLITAK